MDSDDDEPKIGDRIADRYEILAIVGRGRMGCVYKCRHDVLGRVVAIKTLHLARLNDDLIRRRFEREARLASRLEHHNLISVSDFGYTKSGNPYLVMDYVDGEQLFRVLQREGRLEPERAINLFVQICDGLYHAHQRDIMHRDLKPANILVIQKDGLETVKIVDLGIAKIIQDGSSDGSAESEAITKAGEVCGSPVYLSPEQCLYLDLDNRTDIYSLGVCLYECLSGIPPLKASNVYDTLKMHVYETPLKFSVVVPNIEISKRLEEVVFRCLAKSPADRYETMMQLKHDLMRARKSEFDVVSVNVLPPESLYPSAAKRATGEIQLPGKVTQEITLPSRNGRSTQELAVASARERQPGADTILPIAMPGSAPLNSDVLLPESPAAAAQPMSPPRQDGFFQSADNAAGRQTGSLQSRVFQNQTPQAGIQVPVTPSAGIQSAGTQSVGSQSPLANVNQGTYPPNVYSSATNASSGLIAPGAMLTPQGGAAEGQVYNPAEHIHTAVTGMAPPVVPQGFAGDATAVPEKPRKKKRSATNLDAEPAAERSGGFKQGATGSTNESGFGKKIMLIIGACLAVGLSMGVGFATFVNKNNTQMPASQPNAYQPPSTLSNVMSPANAGKKVTSKPGSLKTASSKKSAGKNATAGGASKHTVTKNSSSGKGSTTVASAAHKPVSSSGHHATVSHGGGQKIVRHPDGRVDVYDTSEGPVPGGQSYSGGSDSTSGSSSGDVSIRRHADGTIDIIDTSPTTRRH